MPQQSSNIGGIYIACSIVAIVLILYLYISELKTEYFQLRKAMLNNTMYEVQDYSNPDAAAELLANINRNIKRVISCLISKYPNDARVLRLKSRSANLVIEEAKHVENSSTYTVNKGERMTICLRKKNSTKDLYDIDLLLFVIIHELAHVMTITLDHSPEFMVNFKFILHEAADCGIYRPVNYGSAGNRIDYCGVSVSHNPYFE
jgi:hypothetical protein